MKVSVRILAVELVLCIALCELVNTQHDSSSLGDLDVVWQKDTYPSPQISPTECGRRSGKPSFVCDPAHIISQEEADKIDWLVEQTCNETSCPCTTMGGSCPATCPGYVMAAALLAEIKLPDGAENSAEEREKEIERWAIYLRTKWRLGSCNDDLVIVYVHKDRRVFTNTGRTIRKKLTNDCIDNVFEDTKNVFSGANIGETLTFMVKQYRRILNGGSCNAISSVSTVAIMGIAAGCFAGLIVVFFAILWCFGLCRVKSGIPGSAAEADKTWVSGQTYFSLNLVRHNSSVSHGVGANMPRMHTTYTRTEGIL